MSVFGSRMCWINSPPHQMMQLIVRKIQYSSNWRCMNISLVRVVYWFFTNVEGFAAADGGRPGGPSPGSCDLALLTWWPFPSFLLDFRNMDTLRRDLIWTYCCCSLSLCDRWTCQCVSPVLSYELNVPEVSKGRSSAPLLSTQMRGWRDEDEQLGGEVLRKPPEHQAKAADQTASSRVKEIDWDETTSILQNCIQIAQNKTSLPLGATATQPMRWLIRLHFSIGQSQILQYLSITINFHIH